MVITTLVAAWIIAASQSGSPERPNIIIILADDLGYADISVHGGAIATPNIDAIAGNGVMFTHAYAPHTSCAPSRAGLLTGRHPRRFGFISNPDRVRPTQPGNPLGLPSSEITLGEALRKQGYTTAAIGKWHLGLEPELHPLAQGFDEFFGFLGSLHRYLPFGPGEIQRNREKVKETEYLTSAFTREAVDFIERKRNRPFFLYLAYNAVHTPLMWDSQDKVIEPVTLYGTGDSKEDRAAYRNMVYHLDLGVGKVLSTLKRLGLERNTLLVFINDNGGTEITGAYDNSPLRGYKGELYEGGIRVPFLMQLPGTLTAGSTFEQPVSTMDIFATAIALAGAEPPADRTVDSVNLLPFLTAEATGRPHDYLFWHWNKAMYAVRHDDWKLLYKPGGSAQLFNLGSDQSESHNVASHHPELVAKLGGKIDTWLSAMPDPLWEHDPQL